jgi:hypothetical protein
MSKVDAMRALREARRAAATAGPLPRVAAKAAALPGARQPRAATAAPAGPAGAGAPSGAPELCGHRNMAGRSCTRELDHVKQGTKNHRYG